MNISIYKTKKKVKNSFIKKHNYSRKQYVKLGKSMMKI